MRIGLLTSSYPTSPRGRQRGRVRRDLALELVVLGHVVHVVTPQKPNPIQVEPSSAVM